MHFYFIDAGKAPATQNDIRHHGINRRVLDPLLKGPTAKELDLACLTSQNDPDTAPGYQGQRVERYLEIPIDQWPLPR